MIKRIFPILAVLLFSLHNTSAQDESAWDAKFAFGGGFTPGWFYPDFTGINSKVKAFGAGEFSKSGFFAAGGTGFVSIAVIRNIRIGGMGMGGSVKNSAVVNSLRKEAVYSLGMGGLTIEYTMPFIRSVAISAGLIAGRGGNSIELYENQGPKSWENLWSEASSAQASSKHIKMSNSYFLLAPTLNVDIPVYRFFAFRLGAGYNFALGNSWEMDNGQEILGVPSEINSSSLFLQAGIFIGFFNY